MELGTISFGPPPPETRNVRLEIGMESARGTGRDRAPDNVDWSPNVSGDSAAVEHVATRTDDPDLKQEVTLELPKPQRPAHNAAISFSTSASFYDGAWPTDPTLGEVAEALHRATGLDVVADSFTRARPRRDEVTERRSLAAMLDTLGTRLQYTWKKEGKLLRLRDRFYYRDRPMEVPERILRPWVERVSVTGTPTLDDLGDLARELTDDQLRGMQDYWGWYVDNPRRWITRPHPPAGVYNDRQHFRFWGLLRPDQRQAALGGRKLPVSEMSPAQRLAFIAAVTSQSEGSPEPPSTPVTALTVASGWFSFAQKDE